VIWSTGAGSSYGGHHSSKRATQSIVQREIDLRETAKALADEQQAHDEQKAIIDALNGRLVEAEQTLEQRRADVLAATQTCASVQAEQRNAQRNLDELGNRLRRMAGDLAALEHAATSACALGKSADRTGRGGYGSGRAAGENAAHRDPDRGVRTDRE